MNAFAPPPFWMRKLLTSPLEICGTRPLLPTASVPPLSASTVCGELKTGAEDPELTTFMFWLPDDVPWIVTTLALPLPTTVLIVPDPDNEPLIVNRSLGVRAAMTPLLTKLTGLEAALMPRLPV